MSNDNNQISQSCPCEAVRELAKIVNRHEEQLNKGTTNFAVINTKLNFIIGVMGAIGVAICGVLIKFIFNF